MKNKFILPKDSTLVNVGNSILKYYNVKTFHDSFKPLDDVLRASKKENLCLVLFDALGKHIIEKHKDCLPFIYKHKHIPFNSTFPPTTVNATTAVTTGKYSTETGYIGWNQYYKDIGFLDTFIGRDKITGEIYPDAKKRHHSFKFIWELINDKYGKEVASFVQSFQNYNIKLSEEENIRNHFKMTDEYLKKYKFLYSYSTEPDHTMHENGTDGEKVKNVIRLLNDELEKLVKKNPNTLFILLADHGMVDIKQWFYDKDEKLLSTLESPYFTLEGRFCSFFVKDEEGFIKWYNNNKEIKKNFILKTTKEILDDNMFGYGTPFDGFETYFGNYFLLANGIYSLNDGYGPEEGKFNGNHAGITKEETELYLTIFND